MNNPNSFDEEVQDVAVETNTNPEIQSEGTEETATPETPESQGIDYEAKFKQSAREAQRLYEENKRLQELANQKRQEEIITQPTNVSELYPGFEHLDEDAQRNLIAYTESVKRKAVEEVYKDPDLQYIKTEVKEKRWNSAFEEVAQELPDLKEHTTDFRAKFYNPNVSADPSVLKELAKSYLFDKAREIGAKEERERASRVDLEDITGGDKSPATSARTIEEWTRMSRENPTKFASLKKEFNEDLKRMN
jgi:hypothetical protein